MLWSCSLCIFCFYGVCPLRNSFDSFFFAFYSLLLNERQPTNLSKQKIIINKFNNLFNVSGETPDHHFEKTFLSNSPTPKSPSSSTNLLKSRNSLNKTAAFHPPNSFLSDQLKPHSLTLLPNSQQSPSYPSIPSTMPFAK